MSWREVKPGSRRYSIEFRLGFGAPIATSRMAQSAEAACNAIRHEYPGAVIENVAPMFQKGDAK